MSHDRPLRRGLLAALLTLIASMLLVAPSSSSAEVTIPTAHARQADATYLVGVPAPAARTAACFVDTGLHVNPDTASIVVHSEALDPAQSSDDTGTDLHGSRGVMTAFAPKNGWGTVGIWPQGTAVTINALPAGGQTFPFDNYRLSILRCIQLANVYNIRVIALALGATNAPDAQEMLKLAGTVDQARGAGISVLAAAGNTPGPLEWPAAYGPVLAVGAADAGGALCSFSARGAGLDVLAPGCPVPGASAETGAPLSVSGTSTAEAIEVAALTALYAYRPELTPNQAEAAFTSTAHGGNIDVRAAFEAAGLDSVVRQGEAALAQTRPASDATPSDAVLTTPPRTRHRWPLPRVRCRRTGSRLRVTLRGHLLRGHLYGARAWVAVLQPRTGGRVLTVARRTFRNKTVSLKVPRKGRLRVIVRYLANHTHLQSRTIQVPVA